LSLIEGHLIGRDHLCQCEKHCIQLQHDSLSSSSFVTQHAHHLLGPLAMDCFGSFSRLQFAKLKELEFQ